MSVYILMLIFLFPAIIVNIQKRQIHAVDSMTSLYIKSMGTVQRNSGYFLIIWFVFVTVIMGLRGGITTDYYSYISIFHKIGNLNYQQFANIYNVKNLFTQIEPAYALLNFIISRVTSNSVYLFVFSSLIICLPMYHFIRNSEIPWLSALLWISIGTYLESFNTMRTMMAASIILFSFIHIQNKKLVFYCLVIMVASLFHSTSLIMLPFYFILTRRPSVKLIFILSITTLIIVYFSEQGVALFNSIFNIASNNESAIMLMYRNKSNGLSIIYPIFCSLFSLLLYVYHIIKRNIDIDNKYLWMLFNGTFIWMVLKVLLLFTAYSTRFAAFFSFFICIFLPLMICKIPSIKSRSIILGVLLFLSCIWFLLMANKGFHYCFAFN